MRWLTSLLLLFIYFYEINTALLSYGSPASPRMRKFRIKKNSERAPEAVKPNAFCDCRGRRRMQGGNWYFFRVRKMRTFPGAFSYKGPGPSLAQSCKTSSGSCCGLRVSAREESNKKCWIKNVNDLKYGVQGILDSHPIAHRELLIFYAQGDRFVFQKYHFNGSFRDWLVQRQDTARF